MKNNLPQENVYMSPIVGGYNDHIENQILDEIAEAICILDAKNLTILQANRTFRGQTGLQEILPGKLTCYGVTHHRTTPCEGQGEECPLFNAICNRKATTCDHVHYDRDGKELIVEISVHPVIDSDGEIRKVIHISRDITYRRDLEKRLLKKTEELVEINLNLKKRVEEEYRSRVRHEELLISQSRMAVLGEMFRAMAHQWKQPLSSLYLILEDIEDVEKSKELDSKYLSSSLIDARKQIDHMSGVIEDFRRFLEPSLHAEAFNLLDSIKSFLKLFYRNLLIEGINISIELNNDGKSQVFKDPVRFIEDCNVRIPVSGFMNEFKHVLLNLANNAKDSIKVAKQKPGNIEFRITGGEDVILEIIDNGTGIPDDHIGDIFEADYSTKGEGFGIGLYLVRIIIEDHMKGTITVANNPDCGAVFRLTFPAVNVRKTGEYFI